MPYPRKKQLYPHHSANSLIVTLLLFSPACILHNNHLLSAKAILLLVNAYAIAASLPSHWVTFCYWHEHRHCIQPTITSDFNFHHSFLFSFEVYFFPEAIALIKNFKMKQANSSHFGFWLNPLSGGLRKGGLGALPFLTCFL